MPSVTTHTLTSGRQIVIGTVRGTVIEHRESESTLVSQGRELRLDGTIGRGDITSEIVRSTSFWLRTDDGREEQFTDIDLPVRQGHRLTFIYLGSPNGGQPLRYVTRNDTTGQELREPIGLAQGNSPFRQMLMPGARKREIWRFIFWACVFMFVTTLMRRCSEPHPFNDAVAMTIYIGPILGLIVWVFASGAGRTRMMRAESAIHSEIDGLVQREFAAGGPIGR